MSYSPVSISDVLEMRDRRVLNQAFLLSKYRLPIISFTMNIAGEYKRYAASDIAFSAVLNDIYEELGTPVDSIITNQNAGLEAILVYDADPHLLKDYCISLEEDFAVGRLYDLDVICVSGDKLRRSASRKCIVCGGDVSLCSRSRSHGLDAIKSAQASLLDAFLSDYIGDRVSDILIREVSLTPKPGLVDSHDSGSHYDMDINTFIKSADCLRPYFKDVAKLSLADDIPFEELISLGIKAEKTMFRVTCNVNTHMGAIFLFGILISSFCHCIKFGGSIFNTGSEIAKAILGHNHFSSPLSGARLEACSGFPTVRFAFSSLQEGNSELCTLIKIFSVCNDTNVVRRAGSAGLEYVKTSSIKALELSGSDFTDHLISMNADFISRNISSGGSADILACAMFLNDFSTTLSDYSLI